MDLGGHPLWQKLRRFEFDEPQAVSPFSARLAAEQDWTPAFTDGAIEEYRRFLFLSVVANHPVTPSKVVDEVWHLHLIYTKSYWDALCRDTLDKTLHHVPSTGGALENAKFEAQYAQTLSSYREWFGHAAPDRYWGGGKRPKTSLRQRLRGLPKTLSRLRGRYLGTLESIIVVLFLLNLYSPLPPT